MLLELAIQACLLDNPTKCKEVVLNYVEDATPFQCMMMSPVEIAKWGEYHPRWFAKKWRCQPAGRVAKI